MKNALGGKAIGAAVLGARRTDSHKRALDAKWAAFLRHLSTKEAMSETAFLQLYLDDAKKYDELRLLKAEAQQRGAASINKFGGSRAAAIAQQHYRGRVARRVVGDFGVQFHGGC